MDDAQELLLLVRPAVHLRDDLRGDEIRRDRRDLLCPLRAGVGVTYLEFDRFTPYSQEITAPYRLDCALTYRLPGDPTYYKVETVRYSGIERFPDSGRPAWYSPDGYAPDPSSDPEYYITNLEPWSPSIASTGAWTVSKGVAGYFKEDYWYTAAGGSLKAFRWLFGIPEAGDYNVYAWWSASSARTTNAPYTIDHAAGSTTVRVNQQLNGARWNLLGRFAFDVDSYAVARLMSS